MRSTFHQRALVLPVSTVKIASLKPRRNRNFVVSATAQPSGSSSDSESFAERYRRSQESEDQARRRTSEAKADYESKRAEDAANKADEDSQRQDNRRRDDRRGGRQYGAGGDRRYGRSDSDRQDRDERQFASSETVDEARSNAERFIRTELQQVFKRGAHPSTSNEQCQNFRYALTRQGYTSDFRFQDPVVKYDLDTFQRSTTALRGLFNIQFVVHDQQTTDETEIATRWTLELTPKLTPWAQKLTFTGRSFYTFDVFSGGKISRQKDEWDGLQDNSYFSLEGLSFVLQQLLSGQTSPKLDTPKYVVLKKTKDYEIRNYQPFLAAEVTMPADAKATSGDGFEDLSNYIFGGNRRDSRMEMTTPVITDAGQGREGKMTFPIPGREGSEPEDLPEPLNARVRRIKAGEAVVAVGFLSGLPLNFQVTDAERRLRAALLYDDLYPTDGYKLARYNDPFTPPFLRRNEVLIRLEEFELEPVA